MPEDRPCRLTAGIFFTVTIKDRLLQLLDPIELPICVCQQPSLAVQQALTLSADAQVDHVKALRLVLVYPLLLIGCIKGCKMLDCRLMSQAERFARSPDFAAASGTGVDGVKRVCLDKRR